MIRRFLYASHIRDDIKCPACALRRSLRAFRAASSGAFSRVLQAVGSAWFIYGNSPRPTSLTLRAVCECGLSIDFRAPDDVELFTETTLPAKSGTAPLTAG